MKEIRLFYAPDIASTSELSPEESAHVARVLRMSEGESIVATDGTGCFYDCTLTAVSQKRCRVQIEARHTAPRGWNGHIHLAVAPTKSMDRMEWLVEKATEIGLDRLTFVECRNSERRVVKTERVARIAVSAMKQSHKAHLPHIDEGIMPFNKLIEETFCGQRFIAHCYDDASLADMPDTAGLAIVGQEYTERSTPYLADCISSEGDALVLIGPEGDFSIDEVRHAVAAGFVPVSLGRSRLRTETAALVAVHLMQMRKEQRSYDH